MKSPVQKWSNIQDKSCLGCVHGGPIQYSWRSKMQRLHIKESVLLEKKTKNKGEEKEKKECEEKNYAVSNIHTLRPVLKSETPIHNKKKSPPPQEYLNMSLCSSSKFHSTSSI